MEVILYAVVGVIVFLAARSFTDYEQKDDNEERSHTSSQKQEARQEVSPSAKFLEEEEHQMQIETGIVIAMMTKLSKSDSKICRLEEELFQFCFKDFSAPFDNPSEVEEVLKQIFEDEKINTDNDISDLAIQFYKMNKYAYTKRVKVLQHLINLAYVDKVLADSEKIMIEKVSSIFKINQSDYDQIKSSFDKFYKESTDANIDEKEAYLILNSSPDDTMAEIKSSYRKLVKKYHPDLLHSKGFEDDYVEDCTRKLQEINSAYEIVKAHRK